MKNQLLYRIHAVRSDILHVTVYLTLRTRTVKKKKTKLLQNVLPPINLDVLSIKEEDRGGNQGDVKILGIHWNLVDVNNEDLRHVGKLCCTLGKLE